MHAEITAKREALDALCQTYGVARLEIFDSAGRGGDFDPDRGDIDMSRGRTTSRHEPAPPLYRTATKSRGAQSFWRHFSRDRIVSGAYLRAFYRH